MDHILAYSTVCDECNQIGKMKLSTKRENEKKVREAGDRVCPSCSGKASDGVEFPPDETLKCLCCQFNKKDYNVERRETGDRAALEGQGHCGV
jgi:hypothetical protein